MAYSMERSVKIRKFILTEQYGEWVKDLSNEWIDLLFDINKLTSDVVEKATLEIRKEVLKDNNESLINLYAILKSHKAQFNNECPQCGQWKSKNALLCKKCENKRRRKKKEKKPKKKKGFIEIGSTDLMDHKEKFYQGGSPGLGKRK